VEKYDRSKQATDDKMALAYCMLDNEGYKHTIIIFNNYCISAAVLVTRTHLDATFIRILLVLFRKLWKVVGGEGHYTGGK
jgi:hypothetical protein